MITVRTKSCWRRFGTARRRRAINRSPGEACAPGDGALGRSVSRGSMLGSNIDRRRDEDGVVEPDATRLGSRDFGVGPGGYPLRAQASTPGRAWAQRPAMSVASVDSEDHVAP